ncbi:hypothetical protein Agub_g6026, partial [Astrephomene gubernaculifera]
NMRLGGISFSNRPGGRDSTSGALASSNSGSVAAAGGIAGLQRSVSGGPGRAGSGALRVSIIGDPATATFGGSGGPDTPTRGRYGSSQPGLPRDSSTSQQADLDTGTTGGDRTSGPVPTSPLRPRGRSRVSTASAVAGGGSASNGGTPPGPVGGGGGGNSAAAAAAAALANSPIAAVPLPPGVPPMHVRDMEHYVEAIRIVSVRHYLTCWQLMQLLTLLPPTATDERVETVTAFWARVTDRDAHWVDVMRSLTNDQQVRTGQRLGYMNIYNDRRPAMHYRLRMFKEDEHQLAWQLYNKSLDSPIACWRNLTIDDQPKRVNQGVNMWTVLRGNAADGTTPQTTLEFDFVWPDEDAQAVLAARLIQRAWRLFKNPRGGGDPEISHRPSSTGQPGAGGAAPRFAAFTKKKGSSPASKMNDPRTKKKGM